MVNHFENLASVGTMVYKRVLIRGEMLKQEIEGGPEICHSVRQKRF